MDSDVEENSGAEWLAYSWFNSLDELNSIILDSNVSVADRIQACDVILGYAARMNQGLGDPWIPAERPQNDEDDEDE